MTTQGTSYFPSLYAAWRYYAGQGTTPEAVDQKVKEGDIHIGAPPLKRGQTLRLIDEDTRWAIQDPDEHYLKFEDVAQKLGVDDLKRIVGYVATRDEIIKALAADPVLNNIRLGKWDACHALCRALYGRARKTFPAESWYGKGGWALSDTVCTLKHVARWHVAFTEQENKCTTE